MGSCYAQDTGELLDHAYQLSYEQGCAVDLSAVSATASASCQRWDYRGLGDSATPEAQCTSDPQPMTRSTCCFPIDSMEECEAKCDRFDDANTAFFCPSSCSQGAECCCKVTAEATIDVQEGVVQTIEAAVSTDHPGGPLKAWPYHHHVPSFGEWGFVIASQRALDPQSIPTTAAVECAIPRRLHSRQFAQSW